MLQFGKYKLVQPLGKGGMAQVWLAHKPSLGGAVKVCAVKFPRDIFSEDESEREALFREARVAMLLNHSNIVQVNDVGYVGSLPYVELERIDGIDLSALCEQMRLFGMPFSFSLAAYLLQEILEALAYAHTFSIDGVPQRIVHRDVSPHNVLCSTAGEVKLMDFGIATAASEHSSGHHARGKLRYMAPEHLAARAGPQSDLFAAGAIFWELLEGKKFRQDTPYDDMRIAVLKHEVPAITRADVPRELVRLCRELLEPDLKKRCATADEGLKLLRLWPSSTSERAGLRALLAQHRVTRRSGMTHADIAIPPWLATALGEINSHSGGPPVELPVAPVRDSDLAGAPRPVPREADAPMAMRKRSSLAMPALPSNDEQPGTARLEPSSPGAQRADPTEIFGDSGVGARVSSTAPANDGPDSTPIRSSSRLSQDAETATATGIELPQKRGLALWLALGAFVVVLAGGAAWAAVTYLRGDRSADETIAATKAAPAPTRDETPRPEPSVPEPEAPKGPDLSAPVVVAPVPEPAADPLADLVPAPAADPIVAAPPVAEPVADTDAPVPDPEVARKPAAPTPKKAAKKDVSVKVRLMLVEYAELKIDNKTIVVDPSADARVAAGKHSVKWRLGKTEAWRTAGGVNFGEGLVHVVRIGSDGLKYASSPETRP